MEKVTSGNGPLPLLGDLGRLKEKLVDLSKKCPRKLAPCVLDVEDPPEEDGGRDGLKQGNKEGSLACVPSEELQSPPWTSLLASSADLLAS